jgi:hypothetical protein
VTGDLTGDLMSMASMSCQPMVDSYDYGPIFQTGFSVLETSGPQSARLRRSLQPFSRGRAGSMNGHRFQSLYAAGQPLSSACRADLSEDGEISESDDDDDLPFVMKILGVAKGVQARTGLPESVVDLAVKLAMTTSR